MSPLLYALNIGTLATWLTVAGASSVACVVKVVDRLPDLLADKPKETEVVITPMAMGSAPPAASEATNDAVTEEAAVPEVPEVPEIPEMPEVPEIADLEPLPDVPDLPQVTSPDGTEKPKAPVAKPAARPKTSSNRSTAGQKSTTGESGQGTGTGNGTAKGSGDSPAGASRWVGGSMPKPNYPSSCRQSGQQGRVVVNFTVDERGYVVSASVASGCAYSALNDEALRTVRRWKFKPGPRASASRPIVFQLN
ncbi:energy transducer TonB [Luteolibacter soli]|uniref:Energy transducer TonB n=1 Tax=Luteolibacter soli TaxID=3135280 RepID=A0ABU9B1X9_9BACT